MILNSYPENPCLIRPYFPFPLSPSVREAHLSVVFIGWPIAIYLGSLGRCERQDVGGRSLVLRPQINLTRSRTLVLWPRPCSSCRHQPEFLMSPYEIWYPAYRLNVYGMYMGHMYFNEVTLCLYSLVRQCPANASALVKVNELPQLRSYQIWNEIHLGKTSDLNISY